MPRRIAVDDARIARQSLARVRNKDLGNTDWCRQNALNAQRRCPTRHCIGGEVMTIEVLPY
jgi:hypothetical protein